MHLFKSLPISLVILIADASSSSATLMPRAFEKIHDIAVKHTRGLARDLRVAFSGVLVTQPGSHNAQHVIYCKSGKQGGFPAGGSGGGGTGNGTQSKSPTSSTSRNPSSATKSRTVVGPSSTAVPSSPWKLVESHEGNDFFKGWDFFTGPDTPTHGQVFYLDEGSARANGLLEVNSAGNAIMRVETTPNVENLRQSIRIHSQSSYNGGLFVMRALHMPTGCGVWPAFWTNGPTWPVTGEIDILEGVHDYTNNQATIHANAGCALSSSDSSKLGISGNVIGGTDCAALTTGNQGCGIRASSDKSFGAAFNSNGGGTYAMKWDAAGIAIWFFPSGSEPGDLMAGAPNPETWGLALARWPAEGCDPFQFFKDHIMIFDTTLCGDWAGSVWDAAGIPGQEQSCAQRTGFPTCQAFVQANGASFEQAYWEVQSVKVYQHN